MKLKKRLYLMLVVIALLCTNMAKGGDHFVLLTHNDPVWIYPTAFSSTPKRVIQQTGDINVYTFKVLDDSVFRFKVQIYEPNIDNEEFADAYSDTGWIDKVNATVYMGIKQQDDGRYCMRLYNQPDKSSDFIDIAENDHYTQIGYVDKIHEDWYHIYVIYNGILYSGWTDVYCTNPYNGCG